MTPPRSLLDTALDRAVVPGYSRIGYALRSRWWADDDPAPGSLRGRTALVTGATSGLGRATALGLGALGADVRLVVRNEERGHQVAAELAEQAPEGTFSVTRCDLSDLDDVRRACAELRADLDRVDVLVHNAGAMPATRTESPQGHELTMSLHVLGPVLMTELLRPRMSQAVAGDARAIMVTSGGMYGQRLRDDDPEYLDGEYSPTTAYARSKRAQVDLLPRLAERWAPDLTVHATHPGWADTPGVVESLPRFHRVTGPLLRTAAEGADTTVWLAATQPPPASGHLWHDRRVRPPALLPSTHSSAEAVSAVYTWVLDQVGLA
jgi:NAD(P)-dependent dehydrogenase (short-subunit alcohol dehydrogenase family)